MNTDNWKYVYKISNNISASTNLLYIPKINDDGTILCMDWNPDLVYHRQEKTAVNLIDFFFEREIKYINIFQDKKWAPKIIDIEKSKRKIFLEWNKKSCNHLIWEDNYNPYNLEEQLFKIIKDILDSGFYKLSLYSHCFFLDKQKILKTFDFYSIVEKENPLIEKDQIKEIIGIDSVERFNLASQDKFINFEVFFKNTLNSNLLEKSWNFNPFPNFYRRLFEDTVYD